MSNPDDKELRLPPPDRVVRMRDVIEIETSSFCTLDAVRWLARSLFENPDADHHFYSVEAKPNELLAAVIRRGDLDIAASDRHYYRHPEPGEGFVLIHPNRIEWDWEREVVAKGPAYVRSTVVLTTKTRKLFEARQQEELIRRALAKAAALDSQPKQDRPRFEIVVGPDAITVSAVDRPVPVSRTGGVDLLLVLLTNHGRKLSPMELRACQAAVQSGRVPLSRDEFSTGDAGEAEVAMPDLTSDQRRQIRQFFSVITAAKETRNASAISDAEQALSVFLSSNGLMQTRSGHIVVETDPVRRSEQNAIGKAVRSAIKAIEKVSADLGKHLKANVSLSELGNSYGPVPENERVVVRYT